MKPQTLKAPAVHLAWAARTTLPAVAPQTQASENNGAAPLRAVLRPLPHIPAADKQAVQAESRMRLAVALDVTCSATRKIAPGPTVLVQAVRAWLSLRGRNQSDEVLTGLVEQAQGAQAIARARISRGLTRAASGFSQTTGAHSTRAAQTGSLTTPESVLAANRSVEASGSAIVAEIVLWLTSRERVEYRRG